MFNKSGHLRNKGINVVVDHHVLDVGHMVMLHQKHIKWMEQEIKAIIIHKRF
jgi:hypothetical protein